MLKNKYEGMLNQFEQYYPTMAARTIDWWASGRMSITVKLSDGTLFDYSPMDNSIRRVRVDEYETDETVIRKEFGSNLQKLIPFSGMSKSELAEKVGITNAMLSRYISGKSMPSVSKAYHIAKAIGCRIDELFDSTYIEE